MPRRPLLLLALLVSTSALAQAPTLNLDFEHVYLSDVSRGLEALSSYRQRSLVLKTTTDAGGKPAELRSEEVREQTATGERGAFMSQDVMPGTTMTSGQYELDGRTLAYSAMPGAPGACSELPAGSFNAAPLNTGVSDVTGFRRATLQEAGVKVNGVLTDHYVLDAPPTNNFFDEGSLKGELWLAREGGYLVKYALEAAAGGETTIWRYDLTQVDSLSALTLPAECAAN